MISEFRILSVENAFPAPYADIALSTLGGTEKTKVLKPKISRCFNY
uniref:Uncharacterized protein n=1 Tax=Nelumbo nucifera TaxID=4432 RepID=A0A822ZZA5_NELNU|nr:TPA_asm: hypothetical protein HUJ06_018788 [Nelumbo nucifera]